VVVRNRLAALETRNRRKVERGLEQLAERLQFRIAPGIAERVVFRELFPRGLTSLDALNQRLLGGEPTLSHLSAREEVRALVASLQLPGPRREAAPEAPAADDDTGGQSQLRRVG